MKSIALAAGLLLSVNFLFAQTKEEIKAKAQPVATPITAPPATANKANPATPVVEPKMLNPNAGEFKFVAESHDFGNVPEGPQATYDFEFSNTGKEPILIQNVRASCGCTTPIWPKEPIMPGAKSKITAVYNTKGRPGPFTKSITITSNAKTPELVVVIKGTVEKAPEAPATPTKTPSILNEAPAK